MDPNLRVHPDTQGRVMDPNPRYTPAPPPLSFNSVVAQFLPVGAAQRAMLLTPHCTFATSPLLLAVVEFGSGFL
jgi:hypothetical protein